MGSVRPQSTSQDVSMRVELLKEDRCDRQLWMKAEARRKVEGRSLQEKVKGEAGWSWYRSRGRAFDVVSL